MAVLENTENLILEMQSDKVYFASDYPDPVDTRNPSEIKDLYEFIERVKGDMNLTFAQKSQMIEDKMNGKL